MANEVSSEDAKPNYAYVAVGVLGVVFGLVWILFRSPSSVTYKTVEGISVFAVLYIIAQTAERATEWTIDLVSLAPRSSEKKKKEALKELRAANSTLNGNPTVADVVGNDAAMANEAAAREEKKKAEEKIEAKRLDHVFLGHGLSFAVCALGVNGLNYGLLDHVGAQGVHGDVDRLLTAAAAAGGTKALHELIGRFQKAKEGSEASSPS
jgi:hypothetical protein